MLVEAVASITSPFSLLNGWVIGGAAGRVAAGATAVGEREPGFELRLVAGWRPADPDGERHRAWVRAGWEALRPHSSGQFATFLSDEGAAGVRAAYGDRLDRLTALKDRYDPANVFRNNNNIPPRAERQLDHASTGHGSDRHGRVAGRAGARCAGRAGARLRARDTGRAAAVLGDVEVAVGDLADRASLERAMAGMDRVFLACGNVPGQVERECGAVDAARAAGVGRVVKLSAPRAAADSPLGFERWHAAVERHLSASGVPWVVLRPALGMANLLASAGTIAEMGRMFLPAADAKVAMIHPGDVAAVAAAVLTGDGHDERVYTLTGPEAVTLHQAAEQLSAGLGRPVEFVDVPDEVARASMVRTGLPEAIAGEIVALWGELRRGVLSTTDLVRVLTGREPRSVADFARDSAPAFRAGSQWYTGPRSSRGARSIAEEDGHDDVLDPAPTPGPHPTARGTSATTRRGPSSSSIPAGASRP